MKKFDLPLPALQLLEALAERETLSLAASEVGLSQSAASHALATLEKKLGAPLVVRTSGALRLSETGSPAAAAHRTDSRLAGRHSR